ncbi:MAG TPA: hypothetical protein VEX38_08915, partial [Fimbriimonadaceae bacterium]|nr:hypothetical protein [Fimbriimonadaceae bacterium]
RVAPLVQRQAPALRMGSGDIKALMRSLSPQQRQRHDRQGYLTAADLTQAQLKMLGTLPQSGSWTVSFTIDGDKLTIKNR